MAVPEVSNSTFKTEPEVKKRKRTKTKPVIAPIEESSLLAPIPTTHTTLDSFTKASPNENHKIYREFLKSRRNGDRIMYVPY
ncbi:hypothetical protein NEOKW01_0323 [Nematocida sp. AWRm80]|nr:hypothetical protein NEOKW01_0323 [Nematocida sp. AWRm80]